MTQSSVIDPGTAAFLSFLIPGWGQIRRGKTKTGFLWMAVVLAAYYLMIIPGLVLHFINIIDAYLKE